MGEAAGASGPDFSQGIRAPRNPGRRNDRRTRRRQPRPPLAARRRALRDRRIVHPLWRQSRRRPRPGDDGPLPAPSRLLRPADRRSASSAGARPRRSLAGRGRRRPRIRPPQNRGRARLPLGRRRRHRQDRHHRQEAPRASPAPTSCAASAFTARSRSSARMPTRHATGPIFPRIISPEMRRRSGCGCAATIGTPRTGSNSSSRPR